MTAVAVYTLKHFTFSSYFSLFKVFEFKPASVYSALFALFSAPFFLWFLVRSHSIYAGMCFHMWGTAWLVVTSSLLDCITSEGENERVVCFFFVGRWIRSERGSRMSWRRVKHQSLCNESVSLSTHTVGHRFHEDSVKWILYYSCFWHWQLAGLDLVGAHGSRFFFLYVESYLSLSRFPHSSKETLLCPVCSLRHGL